MDDESRSPGSADMAATPLSDADFRSHIMQKIQAAVVVHGPDTCIVACNPKSCELLGLTEEQMLGRDARHPDWQLVREDGTRLTPEDYPVSRVMATRQPLRDLSLGICRPNVHDVVWVLVSADPVLGQDGGIRQVIVTFMDITEQRSIVQVLHDLARQWNTTFDAINDAVAVIDCDGQILRCNVAMALLVGKPVDELLGQHCHKLMHGTDEPLSQCPIVRMRQTGRRESIEIAINDRWFSVRVDPVHDHEGRLVAGVHMVTDITERRAREEKIRKLNLLKEELLKSAPLVDKLRLITETAVKVFAADFARIWAVGPGDLCEAGCLHAWVTEGPHICRNRERCLHLIVSSGRYTHVDGEKHRRVPLGSYKIGRVATGEDAKFVTNDASHDPRVHDHAWAEQLGLVAFAGYKLISADRQPIGVLALFARQAIPPDDDALLESLASTASQVILTVTAEKALRESEEQFRTIFDSMNDAIFVHDSETGAILDVNERTCEMCACSRAEVCALTVGEISLGTPPYDQAHALEYMRKAAAGEPQRFDWHCRARNGRLFWSEVNIHQVRIGSQDRVLVVVRDISDRKRAEEERDRLNRALEAKNAELESLIYSASHDLRSPLVNVHGFAGSLSDSIAEIRLILAGAQVSDGVCGRLSSILDRDIPEALEFISSGASKMDSLLDGLLQLSRLGRMALDARPLDMNHLMSEVTLAVAFQIQQAGAVVEVEPLPACLGDKGQINQVFSNLLGNALKYLDSSRPGAVRISGRIEKDKVVYCVQDNGIGIPAEHQSRVFEVFYRGGGSSEDGEGLGLSIVRKIVDRHHGEVRVESEVGKGSRFYVSLPTAPENGSLAP